MVLGLETRPFVVKTRRWTGAVRDGVGTASRAGQQLGVRLKASRIAVGVIGRQRFQGAANGPADRGTPSPQDFSLPELGPLFLMRLQSFQRFVQHRGNYFDTFNNALGGKVNKQFGHKVATTTSAT